MFEIRYAPGTKYGEKFGKTRLARVLLRRTAEELITELTGEPGDYVIVDVSA